MLEAGIAKQSYPRTGRPPVENQPESANEFRSSTVPSLLDDKQIERVLATARALLAGALVAAISFVSDKSPFGRFYWLIISGYCAYSLALIVVYRIRPVVWSNGRLVIHVADLLWA